MKKLIALVAAALIGISAFGQDWYIGGKVGFGAAEGMDAGFAFAPDFGYCLSDELNVGIVLGYGTKNAGLSGLDGFVPGEMSWEVCPYLRYIPFSWGNVSFFLDSCLDLYGGRDYADNTYTGFALCFNPGLSLELTDRISVDFTLGLLNYDFTESIFSLNAGALSSIGFFYAF
ncbi:MAG: hypothetical protein J6O01_00155 [Bacteroidales bacterium]|nr:hypothetical protein [Bacteroidales bacterium]